MRKKRERLNGLSSRPEYITWQGMVQRCSNPKASSYKYYGAKGIKVCEEWRQSFQAFYAYVGPKPSPTHSIDRYPNKDGHYEPGNVRWATPQEQGRNRNQGLLTINGVTKHLWEWAELSGLSVHCICLRLRRGIDPIQAISSPIGKRVAPNSIRKKLTEVTARAIISMHANGVSNTEISKALDTHEATVRSVLTGRTWAHLQPLSIDK
jgi:hypothetical protein